MSTEYRFDAVKTKDAVVAWIRDFFEKNGPGCQAVLGLRGTLCRSSRQRPGGGRADAERRAGRYRYVAASGVTSGHQIRRCEYQRGR